MNARQQTREAKYQALTTAAEMIRSHHEHGGIGQEDFEIDFDVYVRECKKVATMLDKKALKFRSKTSLTTPT